MNKPTDSKQRSDSKESSKSKSGMTPEEKKKDMLESKKKLEE